MTSGLEAGEREWIGERLNELIGRLHGRLSCSEAYRAKQQLAARDAEGRPMEPDAARELAAHLERELESDSDYRLLRLLRNALDELNFGTSASAAVAPPDCDTVLRTEIAPTSPTARIEQTSEATLDLMAVASAAVAAMFQFRPEPAATPAPAPTEPAAERDVATVAGLPAIPQEAEPARAGMDTAPPPVEPAAATAGTETAPVLPTRRPAMDVDLAEAGVFASLAKLRAPAAPVLDLEPSSAEPAAFTPAAPAFPALAAVPPATTMANVFEAVAATLAAAERISVPLPERPIAPTDPPIAPSPAQGSTGGSIFRQPADRQINPGRLAVNDLTGTAEIRFVARPASPVLDAMPRSFQTTARPPAPAVKTPSAYVQTPGDWEEASVEIRGASSNLGAREGHDSGDNSHGVSRPATVLNRFVKALRRGGD